ncbi:MAG: hypothetical protein AAFO94_12070, partial [Bacteroidota bacterium]
ASVIFAVLFSCGGEDDGKRNASLDRDSSALLGSGYDFYNNGKDETAAKLPEVYNDSKNNPCLRQRGLFVDRTYESIKKVS